MMRELLMAMSLIVVGATSGPPVVPETNTPAQASIPHQFWTKNVGGRDGAGLCVFTSIQHSAVRQNVPFFEDFQSWMRSKPGGGYPQKVDAMIREKCEKGNQPIPPYLQVKSNDLEILRKACATGRMPAVTYCWSATGRYGGQRIAHMVSLIHADQKWFGILDNNYVGANQIEWLTEAEMLKTYSGMGGGWSFFWLNEGPPPRPSN